MQNTNEKNIKSEEKPQIFNFSKEEIKQMSKINKASENFNTRQKMRFSNISPDFKNSQFSSFASQKISKQEKVKNSGTIRDRNSLQYIEQKRNGSHSPSKQSQSSYQSQKGGNKQKQLASKLKGFGVGLGYEMATTFELYTSQHTKTYNEVQCNCDLQDPQTRKSIQDGISEPVKGESCVRAKQ